MGRGCRGGARRGPAGGDRGDDPGHVGRAPLGHWSRRRSRREIPGDIQLISEPEAAARHYESTSPLGVGRALAVYDLGGGTFDAVVLRKDDVGGVRIVGAPLGISDFGGADFDDIVLRHVIAAAGLSASALSADPAARVGLATLRRECVEAKEALSFDSEAVVPVLVGQSHSTVRLTRSEFEEMIEDGVERTIEVLDQALETAGVEGSDLDAILLTGGSSRIPRIAELLSERFDRPIAIDADPKAIVALGAARALAQPRTSSELVMVNAADALSTELALMAGGAVAVGAFESGRRRERAAPMVRATARDRGDGRRGGRPRRRPGSGERDGAGVQPRLELFGAARSR